jgi:hypothetical protein
MPPRTYADLLSLIKPNDPGGPINAPFLPPTATWADAKSDPVKTLADLIIGAVDPWNQPKGMNAGSIGALLGAALPLLKVGKLAEAVAAEKAGAQSAEGITAYHGSPHDFDKFSLSKIGTGEGAQAYGHGLYFAENEGVARNYRDALGGRNAFGGDLQASPTSVAGRISRMFGDNGNNWRLDDGRDIMEVAEKWAKRVVNDDGVKHYLMRDGSSIAVGDSGWDATQHGRMYKVRINANPDQMLDWDKPYMSQPAAQKLPLRVVKETEPSDSKWLVNLGDETINGFNTKREAQAWADSARGAEVYQSQRGQAAKVVNQRFLDQGIPGIKYLDGGSRAAGEGSRNFVIFDDSLVSILKKYGVALPVVEALRRKAKGGVIPAADVHGAIG